jgi:eukaryotic-like serine/threonine-protein kinase
MHPTLTFDDTEHALLDQQLSAIGPYVLHKAIGAGGMGAVYLAEQTQPIQRHVAIKVTRVELGSVGRIARFESERQILATLKHPNIAQIYDAGNTSQGHPFLVMEFIDGSSIDAFAHDAKLPVKARIALVIQACEALKHAHQNGVIHRDIKPDNLLVENRSNRATVKLIDFGIAKLIAAQNLQTETGRSVGTPAFMSPEQRAGSADIDTRTDVYSLGLTLYFVLTQQLPEPTEPQARLAKPSTLIARSDDTVLKGYGDAVERTALTREFVGDLDWVILKACAQEREQRYGSVGELAADLQRFIGGFPVLAAPPNRFYAFKKYMQRHRWQTTLALGFVLLCSFASIMVVQSWQQERAARALADQQLRQHLAFNAFLLHVLSTAQPRKLGSPIALSDVISHAQKELPVHFKNDGISKFAMGQLLQDIEEKLAFKHDSMQAPKEQAQ